MLFDKGDNDYSFTLSNNTQRFETKNFYFEPKKLNDSTVLNPHPLFMSFIDAIIAGKQE